MKRVLACLLAVMLLASLSVSAFAVGNISGNESVTAQEVKSAADADNNDVTENLTLNQTAYDEDEQLAAFVNNFEKVFEENSDLQAAAGESGVEVASAFTLSGEGVSFPVKAELKVASGSKFVALMYNDNGKWIVVPAEIEGDTVKAELPGEGIYALIGTYSIGPSANGNTYIITHSTQFVDSAEVEGPPMLVHAYSESGAEVRSFLVITPYDEKYSLHQINRDRFTDETDELTNSFAEFVAINEEFAGTAPSDAFFASSNDPSNLELPAEISMTIEDSDIFRFLLVYKNGEWSKVDASVANGELSFTLRALGTYVILSEAAA